MRRNIDQVNSWSGKFRSEYFLGRGILARRNFWSGLFLVWKKFGQDVFKWGRFSTDRSFEKYIFGPIDFQ